MQISADFMHLCILCIFIGCATCVPAGDIDDVDHDNFWDSLDAEQGLSDIRYHDMPEEDYYATFDFLSPSIFDHSASYMGLDESSTTPLLHDVNDPNPIGNDLRTKQQTDYFSMPPLAQEDKRYVAKIYSSGDSGLNSLSLRSSSTPVHQTISSLFGSSSGNPFLDNRRRNSVRSRRRDVSVPRSGRGRPLLQRSATDQTIQQDRSQSSIRERKGVYDETREHACELCGKRFERFEHVSRHIRSIHTQEKPFKCHICHKSFSRSDNLRQHLRVHDNETK